MAAKTPQYCDVSVYDTIPKVVAYNAKNWPTEVAMREKEFGIWIEYSWQDYYDHVRSLALGLKALGMERGDCVGLLGDNRPDWVWGEIAAHAMGGLSMGIYQDSIGDEVTYLVNYAEVKFIIAEDEEQVDKLLELIDDMPSIRNIVYCDPRGMRKYDDARLIDMATVRERGRALDAEQPGLYDDEVAKGSGDDVSILLTTSGTTARPKLAMMQSGHFMAHSVAYLEKDTKYPGDNYVSSLPLPWVIEQKYVVVQAPVCRVVVNFVEEAETMMADLREVGPHAILLAPRSWEAIAADVRSRMMDASALKRRMFDWGMKMGMAALDQGRRSKLADFLLFRALRDRLGFTFLTSAATGGAAMGPDTFKFFQAMGVPLRQLYGQTELGGAYTIHEWTDIDFDTVGKPFDNSEVRIENPDENGVGEIVARTGGMFLGYFRNEEATKEDVRDGWMYTGDAGYFDAKGHLVVIDRIKDIATTSTGTNFSPMFIENKLKFSPFIAEAVILGHDKPYLAAIICIRYEILGKWAEQRGIAFTNYTNLSGLPEVYKMIRAEVEKVNDSLPEAHRIQKFLLLYKELDADDGELTRTRKVRRGVINEKYADIIDAIYSDRGAVHVDTTITFQDGTKSRIVTDLVVEDLGGAGESPRQAAE
ncbi:MAG: long-chain fatty acid--CoA ligase [Hyphomicrobiales bacterium]|nr:long-chain fatty acid--CoA ligase [Hyphomicrobiales bacterium]MCP5373161.1 long-chain fatty acid--CoA ligase [Hyphomicrobiales bacterium]